MIAEVVINTNVKKLNHVFDYNVPAKFADTIKIGDRVLVSFGNKKTLEEGFIIGFKNKTNFAVKDIVEIQKGCILSDFNMKLAQLMSRKYFCNVSDCIKVMLPPGTATKSIENRIKEKSARFVSLNKSIEEIDFDIENKKIKSEKQIKVIEFLKENENIKTVDLQEIIEVSSAVLKTLERNGIIKIEEYAVERNPFLHKHITSDCALKLTKEQEKACLEVENVIESESFSEFLLYGVTGSGKTEVYLQLIEKVIIKGKSAIVLVPEISLTPQMVDRFIARFGKENIAVLHSKLSQGERFDEWQKIQRGDAKIVIGARSAIFAPVSDLGLIIIDEEHDASYKSEMPPKYNAKEIARYIAKQKKIPLILGSATPDIATFYRAKNEKIKLLELTKRANNSSLPDVEIVDLRYELATGNRSMLSNSLYNAIEENLKNKKQTILFLNRRGYSTFVMCRDCGYTAQCKNCNITLTYHSKEDKLKCHYCGYEQKNFKLCPECNSKNIKYFGTGTQKLEAEIEKIFPSAKTIRMDIDTVSKKNSYEDILNKFKNENIDILIGTQMVVKGHHFPNVTLVGVIAADSSLYIEDYRANERTFQTLTQVAGRAGREQVQGKVIVQTYNPSNFSIQCSQKQNYGMFYETEIELRKQLKYPPFCDIISIVISGEEELFVEKLANNVYMRLKRNANTDFLIYKAMPAPIDKIKNKYRWRIICKCKLNNSVIDMINSSLEGIKLGESRISIDVNPVNMM